MRCAASARAIASSSARPAPTTRSTNRSAPGGAMPAWSTGCRSITSGWKPCSTTCRAPGSRSTTRRRRFAATGSRRSPIPMRRATTSPPRRAPVHRSIARSAPTSSISTAASGRRRCTAGRSCSCRLSRQIRATATRSMPAPARRATSRPSAPTRMSCCSRRCAITSKPSANPAARPRSPHSARARPTGC